MQYVRAHAAFDEAHSVLPCLQERSVVVPAVMLNSVTRYNRTRAVLPTPAVHKPRLRIVAKEQREHALHLLVGRRRELAERNVYVLHAQLLGRLLFRLHAFARSSQIDIDLDAHRAEFLQSDQRWL